MIWDQISFFFDWIYKLILLQIKSNAENRFLLKTYFIGIIMPNIRNKE
jgi:hypothetical protein